METEIRPNEARRLEILKRLEELQIPSHGTDPNLEAEIISQEIKKLEKELLEIDPPRV